MASSGFVDGAGIKTRSHDARRTADSTRGIDGIGCRYRSPRALDRLKGRPAADSDPADAFPIDHERETSGPMRQSNALHGDRCRCVPAFPDQLAGHACARSRHGTAHCFVPRHRIGAIHLQERDNTPVMVADRYGNPKCRRFRHGGSRRARSPPPVEAPSSCSTPIEIGAGRVNGSRNPLVPCRGRSSRTNPYRKARRARGLWCRRTGRPACFPMRRLAKGCSGPARSSAKG